MEDNVYDVSEYIQYHPGGKEILEKFGGKEATQ